MTDHEFTSPAGVDPAIGADRIDAYITSVEQVLLAARVPATERVQILGDLETQITEMLNSEPLPISDATVAAVLTRLEPPSHFAATSGPPSSAAVASPISASIYNPSLAVAAVSCAFLLLMCLLLLLLAGPVSSPSLMRSVLALLLLAAIVTPLALRHGVAQLRAQPHPQRGRQLAVATTIVYCTVAPLLLLLFACALTDGYILFPIGIAAFGYFQYHWIRRLLSRISNSTADEHATRSSHESLWRFARPAQPTSC